ncbi:MAG: hypothetical protein A2297_06235 [Elusimicrobia bacterium RIFOXYB2_FULL_48_7]|nr:MAG: hypothetical protein A2297_06235 [Elusimicrobia bacterium RIFOXYB2_FULL_48_7]
MPGNTEDNKNRSKNSYGRMVSVSSLGINLVVSTAVGLAIGIYLDKFFKTSFHYFTLIFLVIGIVAGFWQLIKEIMAESSDVSKHKKNNP